jgi:hypothetical protein
MNPAPERLAQRVTGGQCPDLLERRKRRHVTHRFVPSIGAGAIDVGSQRTPESAFAARRARDVAIELLDIELAHFAGAPQGFILLVLSRGWSVNR